MDKMITRTLIVTLVFIALAFAPQSVLAQNPLVLTQIVIGGPDQSNLGESITVQAVLADNQGQPISNEVIYFTTQATFLGKSDDVVLAQAVTNANGQAVAQFTDNVSGPLTLQAEFRGDTQYASSNATIQIATAGEGQEYVEHVGVDLPGFNVPPVGAPMASIQSRQQGITGFVQSLWPAMNGWPIAAVLFIVWALYFFAVTFVLRVAALGSKDEDLKFPTTPNPRRSS